MPLRRLPRRFAWPRYRVRHSEAGDDEISMPEPTMKKFAVASLIAGWLICSFGALWHFEARDALFATLCSAFKK